MLRAIEARGGDLERAGVIGVDQWPGSVAAGAPHGEDFYAGAKRLVCEHGALARWRPARFVEASRARGHSPAAGLNGGAKVALTPGE